HNACIERHQRPMLIHPSMSFLAAPFATHHIDLGLHCTLLSPYTTLFRSAPLHSILSPRDARLNPHIRSVSIEPSSTRSQPFTEAPSRPLRPAFTRFFVDTLSADTLSSHYPTTTVMWGSVDERR